MIIHRDEHGKKLKKIPNGWSRYVCLDKRVFYGPPKVYPVEAKRWMTLEEYKTYMNNRQEPKEEEVPIIVEVIRDFLVSVGGQPEYCHSSEDPFGHKGLTEYIIEEGINPQKYVKDALNHIMAAWKLYRVDHPAKVCRYEELRAIDQAPKITEGKTRTKLFGHPVTAIIRWMGTDFWSYDEAVKALKALEVFPAEATVRIQLRAGKKGERGEPATLSEEEINILYEALNDK